jgi:hypothetical protein
VSALLLYVFGVLLGTKINQDPDIKKKQGHNAFENSGFGIRRRKRKGEGGRNEGNVSLPSPPTPPSPLGTPSPCDRPAAFQDN